ncbi:hypothetical protein OB920_09275 [Halobacteria archaeon HArc-gm2]|nr:hypothetical protein [Halobacteria archaeon HArc-gm2]
MALYALDDVDDAYGVTRAFLTSIDRTTWLKLALIVFFVGGAGANFPGTGFSGGNGGTDPGAPPAEEFPAFDPGPDVWLLVGAVALVLVAIVLALFFVAAVMEFVFVESLRTEDVSIRAYWGRYWRKGLRLFVFRLVLWLVFLAPFLVVMALFFAPVVLGAGGFAAPLAALFVLLPVVFVLAVVVGLVDSFTTNFVVPIMLLEDRAVLDGWRRLWPTIRTQWKQYLAYAVAAWILSLVGGVLIAVVAGILIAVLFVPFGILLAVGIGLLSVFEPVGIAWLVVTGLLFGLAALVVALLVTVPVQTYLRYYALLVLGDVDAEFDVIPEQRAAVRSDVDEAA